MLEVRCLERIAFSSTVTESMSIDVFCLATFLECKILQHAENLLDVAFPFVEEAMSAFDE